MNLVKKTPLRKLQFCCGNDLLIKDETQQNGGAFKIRGPANLLAKLGSDRNVITASTGNHAIGLSKAARANHLQARVFLPRSTPEGKQSAIRAAGGRITCVDGIYEDALAAALACAQELGDCFIPSYDHDDIIEGNMTLFREATEQHGSTPSDVFLPLGGGGLASAACRYFDETVNVHVVEFDGVPRLAEILKSEGLAITIRTPDIPPSVEGIGLTSIGAIPKSVLGQRKNLTIHQVTHDQLIDASALAWTQLGIRAELAGVASIAAAMAHGIGQEGATLCVVSGGNIDETTFQSHVSQRAQGFEHRKAS